MSWMSSIWEIVGSRSRSHLHLKSLIIYFSKSPADRSSLQIVVPGIVKTPITRKRFSEKPIVAFTNSTVSILDLYNIYD